MAQSTTATTPFTPRATLAALGCQLQRPDRLAPIRAQVRIAQKAIAHTPARATSLIHSHVSVRHTRKAPSREWMAKVG